MNDTISIQEALVYVMVIMSAADSSMTDSELSTMGEVAKTLPVFADYDPANVLPAAQRCGERLQAENGLAEVLDLIADTLPVHLFDTGYALAVEVAAADLGVSKEELRILQLLRDRFNLDKLTTAAIERGAIARFKKA
ncbi:MULTISPECIES: tellurite resistance TerB family protein [Stappiaceae]|uniref:Tellurite resistance TerB family protein n=1 Tax=Roseibium polysiphoniae TaxID=2571221 RepID=A0A944CFC4_9HYPH|nr:MULTISPECIES: tellurite resistance TerB family protein [Stappiaceae]MBD8877843.1 tellurite resistance TerB family protein [Roseibium polysiphoniae]MBS8261196.1 Tellurite resistance protein TerB [Roseibium polysiphoniae]